ncbi:glycosyltransferase [Methylobacterium sp. J-067]|uniref:glycosyltransferase n=1 Tax=Methylobacterium sp. J-067 TaxID=2836648 RepID=UPI001FBBFB31|nr:glycosyltransferase [Methylobacterium sp. J-067]
MPSRDTARRYARYLRDREFTIRPHFDIGVDTSISAERPQSKDTSRTIVIIGALGPSKGSALVYDCAKIALKTYPDLRFHIVGYTDRDAIFAELGNVSITGQYDEEDLGKILRDQAACAAWFPAVWPETFSYTLSAAFAARLMPIAFDFGAIAERIRAVNWGVLLPPEYMLNIDMLVDNLATFDVLPPPERLNTGQRYPQIVRDYYEAPAAWAGIGRWMQ